MNPRKPTILDIAAALNLSKTTVSDALQGKGRVSAATIAQVQATAKTLGYVGNRAAKQLRASAFGAYGLYIPPVVRSFAFYMDFVSGAISAADSCGADIVLITRDAKTLSHRPPAVDGIVAIDPLPGDAVLEALAQLQVPLVTAGRPPESLAPQVSGIIEVNYAALVSEMLATAHQQGKRHPVLLVSDQDFRSSFTEDVLQSFRQWCGANDVTPRVLTLSVHPEPNELSHAIRDLLAASPCDLIVCGYQGLAGRVLPLLSDERRIEGEQETIPDVVSLVGDPLTELPDTRVTCLEVHPKSFGQEAIQLLHEIVEATAVTSTREHTATLKWATAFSV